MKLLFAVKALDGITGGAERVLCDVASALAARGHDVCVLSFDSPGGSSFYPLLNDVRRLALGIGKTTKRATLLETVCRMYALRKAVSNEKPDAVIAFMHSMFIPASFALIGTGVAVVGSEHIVPEHYSDRKLEFALLVLSSFFMRKITVLSSSIRDSYPPVVRRKMVAIPNPVTIPEAQAGTRLPVILNVGRLEPQKDQETLIRAFARLAAEYPGWGVRIMGDGRLKDSLQKLIDRLGLSGRVVLGGITRDIGGEYSSASIFALPSRYESFGLATAEAMAHALPVIGFGDCPGTNELISNGRNGLLVHNADRVAGFADALRDLMDNEGLRQRIGAAARADAGVYSPENVVNKWEQLLVAVKR